MDAKVEAYFAGDDDELARGVGARQVVSDVVVRVSVVDRLQQQALLVLVKQAYFSPSKASLL